MIPINALTGSLTSKSFAPSQERPGRRGYSLPSLLLFPSSPSSSASLPDFKPAWRGSHAFNHQTGVHDLPSNAKSECAGSVNATRNWCSLKQISAIYLAQFGLNVHIVTCGGGRKKKKKNASFTDLCISKSHRASLPLFDFPSMSQTFVMNCIYVIRKQWSEEKI